MISALPLTEPQTDSPLQQYYFRAIVCFAAAGTLASTLTWSDVNYIHAATIILLLTYAYCTYHFTRKLSGETLSKVTRWLSYCDAAFLGVVVSLTNFSLLPCIMFLTIIQFNALLSGGVRKWLEDNAAFAVGIIIALIIYQPKLILSSSIEISAASLIGIITYFLIYAVYMNQRFRKLSLVRQQLENEQKWHKIRAYKLSRYLPPTVWKAINEGKDEALQAERKKITVFFSDIKNFSELSEEMEAEALTELLNHYLTEMSRIVAQYGGTIDKFMGDAIMVLFGDSNSQGVKADCLHCVSMAIAMKKKMRSLRAEWYSQGIKNPLQIRMGINTGFCTVGTFGTSSHLNYTVLGTQVNLASRLESAAEPDEILISHETWSLVRDSIMCRDKGEIQVKGFTQPVRVYQVADFRRDLGKSQTFFEDRTEGFSLHMDIDKIRNYDKEKVIDFLETAANKLKEKVII